MSLKLQTASDSLKSDTAFMVPGSKSLSNRVLILAAMAEGSSLIKGLLFSDDTRYMLTALQNLGLEVSYNEKEGWAKVKGCSGRLARREPAPVLFVGNAGTAARFLPSMVAACEGNARFTSDARMSERPIGELLEALRDQGSDIEGEAYPFTLRGAGLRGGPLRIDIEKSSQFASGLAMAAPSAKQSLLIDPQGREQIPYVAMTFALMKDFGIEAVKEEGAWSIPLGRYRAREYQVEPDMSGAAYLFAAACLLGGKITIAGLSRASLQGDIAFLQVLRHMGAAFFEDPEGLTIEKDPAMAMKGLDVDMNAFSDQALTLAALAPFCDSPTRIRNVGHIRQQECDRIAAIVHNLRAMKIEVEDGPDWIVIQPGKPEAVEIKTFGDHRVAMAFSLVGLRVEGMSVDDPACVSKTFENYWNVYEELRQASVRR